MSAELRATREALAAGRGRLDALADTVDGLLRSTAGASGDPGQPWALLALGSYGRREMAPHSDVDVQFLVLEHDASTAAFVEACLHSFWDEHGLRVGYATRTVREAVELAAQDMRTATSLLDARLVTGDPTLLDSLEESLDGDVLASRRSALFADLLADRTERHRRLGDTVFLLEPHLKSGAGGIRDIHGSRWAARIIYGAGPIRCPGITDQERADLLEAYDTARLFRNVLHGIAGRRQERLYFAYQERVALALGNAGVPECMQRYWRAAARVRALTRRILDALALEVGGSQPRSILLTGPLTPRQVVGILRRSSDEGLPLHPSTLEAAARTVGAVDDSSRCDPALADDLLHVLLSPSDRGLPLALAHEMGILQALIPELGPLTGLYQHNVFHVYTVDVHTLEAVRVLKRLASGEIGASEEHAARVMARLEERDRRILFLGVLLHDLHKCGAAPESAGAAAARLGLAGDDCETVVLLVRRHLTMALLAQTRDVHDEGTVRHLARLVGDRRTLAMLYLVTWADMSSANPDLLTGWKAAQIQHLFDLADRLLCGGLDLFADQERVVQQRRDEVLRLRLGDRAPEHPSRATVAVDSFIEALPTRYCVVTPAPAILEHMALCEALAQKRAALRSAEIGAGIHRITVCCRDTPGLLARLSGTLAAHRVNIIGAEVFGRTDGTVIDLFDVEAPVPWEALSSDLERAVTGELDPEVLLRARERPSPIGERPVPPVAKEVRVDNTSSASSTIFDVVARDRPGLLFRLTRCFHRNGLDIRLARIATEGHTARDAFYVEWLSGGKLQDRARIERFAELLSEAIDEPL